MEDPRKVKLYDAARQNDVSTLLNMLSEHPEVLSIEYLRSNYEETPLHVAAMLGNVEFAREMVARSPSMAIEVDFEGCTPLHLAAATDCFAMVQLLTIFSPANVYTKGDQFGRNPLHIAAINGKIRILKWLMQVNREAAARTTNDGSSVLHLCVAYNQVEALKVLLVTLGDNAIIVNSKDSDGYTALHLAVIGKQFKAIDLLLGSQSINVNVLNKYGQTALDMLNMKHEDIIKQVLVHKDAVMSSTNTTILALEKVREPGMVATSLIAAATLQAAINPPGGVWQDSNDNHTAGKSVLADLYPQVYKTFLLCNTLLLFASILVFTLLVVRPFRKVTYYVLIALTTFTVFALPTSYALTILAVSTHGTVSLGQLYLMISMGAVIITIMVCSN